LFDTYRKLRNTARYALGNIFDFDPKEDRVEHEELWEVDRWALAATNQLERKVIDGYRSYE